EVVGVVAPGGVARGRDGDALVSGDRRSGELGDDPPSRELVVEDDRVAEAVGLTDVAGPGPERRDVDRTEDAGAGGLVEDLEACVDSLDVLRRADLAVRVRRRAVA